MQRSASKCDAFSPQPTLYYRGSSKITSVKGCISTIVIAAIILGITVMDIFIQLTQLRSEVTQYRSVHRYIDLVEFNPFVEDNMQLAFTIKNELNSDARVNYIET